MDSYGAFVRHQRGDRHRPHQQFGHHKAPVPCSRVDRGPQGPDCVGLRSWPCTIPTAWRMAGRSLGTSADSDLRGHVVVKQARREAVGGPRTIPTVRDEGLRKKRTSQCPIGPLAIIGQGEGCSGYTLLVGARLTGMLQTGVTQDVVRAGSSKRTALWVIVTSQGPAMGRQDPTSCALETIRASSAYAIIVTR